MQKFWGQLQELQKILSIHDKSIPKKVSKSMTFVENTGILVLKLACDICVIDFYTIVLMHTTSELLSPLTAYVLLSMQWVAHLLRVQRMP